jgi:hypothetical protein
MQSVDEGTESEAGQEQGRCFHGQWVFLITRHGGTED